MYINMHPAPLLPQNISLMLDVLTIPDLINVGYLQRDNTDDV